MRTACRLGLLYFLQVFSVGIVFGSIRELLVVPSVGHAKAVVLELPFMIWICAFVASRLFNKPCMDTKAEAPAKRTQLAQTVSISQRIVAGLVAFAVLMLTEILLSMALRGLSMQAWLDKQLYTLEGRLTLFSFLVFATLPVIVSWRMLSQSNAAAKHQ